MKGNRMQGKAVKFISVIIIILCVSASIVLNRTDKENCVVGSVINKTETVFTIKTKSSTIVVSFPPNYDTLLIQVGDEVAVFYEGEILETSPLRIKNAKEIMKK